MTSRNLCFKLMREDMKRRVWTIAWSVLSMMFGLVVPVALKCSDYVRTTRMESSVVYQQRMMRYVLEMLHSNTYVIVVMLIGAVLWGMSGYHYLHNSRKTDFYHSLPVKRHQLFAAIYLNGILVPFVCYFVAEVFAMMFAVNAGIGLDVIGSLPWKSMLLNMVYYGLIYTTVIIAMMMTGHIVIAVLATGVFMVYGPALAGLYQWYCNSSFHTYVLAGAQEKMLEKFLKYSSPFANYMVALFDYYDEGWAVGRAVPVFLVTAAMVIIAYGLYRLRPSEAAGKAMAFERTKTPIKVLITLPVGVAAGLFFGALTNRSLSWMVFGAISGAVMTHCLMEIIYHFDFRKLFAKRYQLVICTVASLIVVLAGYYDLYGYDKWYPSADKLADAAVVRDYNDYWVTYGQVAFIDEGASGHYVWNYESSQEYRFEHMKLTDVYAVSELARKGAENEAENRYGSSYLGDYNTFTMRFKLTNGKEVYRSYTIRMDVDEKELFASLADSWEYKVGMYPILTQAGSDTAAVYFQQNETGGERPVALDASGRAQLLAAYQKDFEELTVETMKHEIPIGSIQFRTVDHEAAVRFNRENAVGYSYVENRSYYPVYPSFARTLGLLQDAGEDLMVLDENNIIEIQITHYNLLDRGWAKIKEIEVASGAAASVDGPDVDQVRFVYTEEEDIKALAPALHYTDYVDMNSFIDNDNFAEYVEVAVIFREPGAPETQETQAAVTLDDAFGDESYPSKWTRRIGCRININELTPETAAKYRLYRD